MDLMPYVDRATRAYWRLTGRRVDLAGDEWWLEAPTSRTATVGDVWVEALAATHGGTVARDEPGAGLLADMSLLDGPTFRADALRPEIRDFYEHTTDWRMEVWSEWQGTFRPTGALIERMFGRRVSQLALPVRSLDVAHGMESRVAVVRDGDGVQRAAAWTRTLRSTGAYVYSGAYSVRRLPGADAPSVHVAFPLEHGNVQVFLRPHVTATGSLRLLSDVGRFGSDGAYVVVRRGADAWAARVPIHERFDLYMDDDGVLRTDHALRLWSATALRLHYKLTRSARAARR